MEHSYFQIVLLGIVEGLTEFIPVSSTGHLILVESFLKRSSVSVSVFDIFIQMGAILAVVWVRQDRVFKLSIGFFNDSYERVMGIKIIAAFLPAAIAGVFLHSIIKSVLFSPWVVAVSLIFGGIIMILIEQSAPEPKVRTMDSMPLRTALGIGFCQIMALIPGISRAGASIVGAQYLGVERKTATEFSFFLAIPTVFGAAVYDLYKNIDLLTLSDMPVFAIGAVAAFVSALLVVTSLINFVSKYGFKPFGYYRIGLGLIILIILMTTGIVTNTK